MACALRQAAVQVVYVYTNVLSRLKGFKPVDHLSRLHRRRISDVLIKFRLKFSFNGIKINYIKAVYCKF